LKPLQIERPTADGNIIDILDRVLDKGIVLDAWLRLSIGGIELVTVDARVVIASIATYLKHSHELKATAPGTCKASRLTSRPLVWVDESPRTDAVIATLTPSRWARSIGQWPMPGFRRA